MVPLLVRDIEFSDNAFCKNNNKSNNQIREGLSNCLHSSYNIHQNTKLKHYPKINVFATLTSFLIYYLQSFKIRIP